MTGDFGRLQARNAGHTLARCKINLLFYYNRGVGGIKMHISTLTLLAQGFTMEGSTISQLIGTLGFPIVACGALFWLVNKNESNRREDNEKNETTRREDNAKITEALNNNTLVITKLVSKMGDVD